MARWLRCLHCRLTARRSWIRIPHGALLALGGRSSPDLQCSGGLSPGAFLCGVCMFSPCSQGVSSTKNLDRKTCKKNRTLLTKTDRSLGPRALKSCPLLLGYWRKDSLGWENAEQKFTATLGLRVRPMSPPYIHVSVAVCRLCH